MARAAKNKPQGETGVGVQNTSRKASRKRILQAAICNINRLLLNMETSYFGDLSLQSFPSTPAVKGSFAPSLLHNLMMGARPPSPQQRHPLKPLPMRNVLAIFQVLSVNTVYSLTNRVVTVSPPSQHEPVSLPRDHLEHLDAPLVVPNRQQRRVLIHCRRRDGRAPPRKLALELPRP